MKCMYSGKCKFGKGNENGKCRVALKFPQYCQYRVREKITGGITMDEKTPVIFRKWHNGDIIALFPAMPGTNDPCTCGSYEHVGQHGAAFPDTVITVTTPAKPQEYAELLSELRAIGYDTLKGNHDAQGISQQ